MKSNMEPCRKSRRLQGLEPEISTTTFRCFCLLDGDTCATTATLLPCCRQFIHKACQEQWIRAGHSHCAMCRQRWPRQARIPFPDPDMTVPQVVERLSRLLATQALREELDELPFDCDVYQVLNLADCLVELLDDDNWEPCVWMPFFRETTVVVYLHLTANVRGRALLDFTSVLNLLLPSRMFHLNINFDNDLLPLWQEGTRRV